MKTKTNIEKLKAIPKPSSTDWLKVAEDLEENEALTLETISKLESALGTTLIEIADSSATIVSEPAGMPAEAVWF